MKKRLIVLSCIFAFAALIWTMNAPDAEAYSDFSSCAGCHSVFGSGPGNAAHDAHAATVSSNCAVCHPGSVFNNPPIKTGCAPCHVGEGLRQHHRLKAGQTCAGCHTNPENGGTENTTPPGYAGTALNTCNGSEELFTSFTISLDNDGDGLTDGADPDCAPAGNLTTSEWNSLAGYLDGYITSQYVIGPDVLGLGDGDNEYGFLYTGALYKSRVDSNNDNTVCGVGDDMANRPVLVDNLITTSTLIPGTSIRSLWKDASTAYGSMSSAVISAVRDKVIAHRDAGFSDDIVVY